MLESPHFIFNEHIFFICLSNWQIFIILDAPKGELQFFLNAKTNGAMYKEFKLKKTHWIIMLSFCKSPLSLSKVLKFSLISTIFYTIGCAKRRTTKYDWMSKEMEQHTKSSNSKTQTKLLCSIFTNQPLHFQKA